MTVEYILLLGLFVFLLLGAFMGDHGPRAIFKQSAPRLGARVEQQISTGQSFPFPANSWNAPPGPAPSGTP